MANNIQVKILGDSKGYSKALNQSEGMTKRFGKAVDETGHRVHSLHVSLMGATAALVGGAGLEMGLKAVVEAAKKAQESQDHLNITMKDAGLSYAASRKEIEAHISALSQLSAFQKSDLRETFTALIRSTKDVGEAMKETSLAADIARGRHIDLASAQQIVIKANIGMTGALRRMGIDIKPVHDAMNALTDSHKSFTTAQKDAAKALDTQATKLKAIDLLTRTYSGNAKAYGESAAGASDRFKTALTNLEVQVGDALLPTLTEYLKKAADWLTKLEKSGKLQRDVNGVLKTASGIVHDLTPVVKGAAKAAQGFADAVGGWKHAAEIVLSGVLAWKLLKVAAAVRDIGLAAGIASGEKGVGGLIGSLGRLKGMGPLGAIGAIGAGAGLLGYAYSKGFTTPNATKVGTTSVGTDIVSTGGKLYVSAAGRLTPYHGPAPAPSTSTSRDAPGRSPGGAAPGATSGVIMTGDTAGLDGGFYGKLKACCAAAGATQATVISGRRSVAHNAEVGGAANSNHLTGHAADGSALIGGRWVPFGLLPNPGAFGLRSGATFMWAGKPDINHIDDGTNVGGAGTGSGGTGAGTSAAGIVSQGTSKTPPWKGATDATIITAKGAVTATLKGLPTTLDSVEQTAVKHIEALKKKLQPHMTAADLAKTKVELAKWGKVLHDEVNKNAKTAAAAAADAKKMFDRALSLDVSHILRDFDRQFAAVKSKFDKETAAGLLGLAAPTQTPEEKALADFIAKRTADDLAKSRADALANAQTPEEAAALALGFSLDDQQAALQAAADASRVAADKKAADAQQAYQDQRDAAWQALQDINDDQRTALQNNLDDWNSWLGEKKKSWTDFVGWLNANGLDSNGLVNPGASGSGSGNASPGASTLPRFGKPIPMAAGGVVMRPTFALVGEAGPEAVIPLSRLSGAGSGGDIVIQIDGREVFRVVQKHAALDVRQGGSGVPG